MAALVAASSVWPSAVAALSAATPTRPALPGRFSITIGSAERLRQMLGIDPHDDVEAGAGGERGHDGDRPRRIGLRLRGRCVDERGKRQRGADGGVLDHCKSSPRGAADLRSAVSLTMSIGQ